MYRFTPTISGIYTFETSNNDDCDPYLVLLDASSTVIDSNDDGAGSLNAKITYNLLVGQTYYLQARNRSNSVGTARIERYMLTVSFMNDLITLDSQNGSGGTAVVAAKNGTALPSIAVPTRSGFTFGGYYTSTDGGGTQYFTASGTATRTWDLNTSTTLYAKWTPSASSTYTVTVNSGTGGGNFAANATVTITANAAPSGKVFDKWTTSDGVSFANANSTSTSFTMPAKNVAVTATYKDAPATTYTLTVNSGTGGGNFMQGATVTITANAAPSGKVFDKWTTSDGVSFANANNATTSFTMPAKSVVVTATYKDAPATTYALTVNSGTGGGNFAAGASVTITANAAPSGKVFDKWTTTDGVSFANANSANTSFTMPAKNVTVTATYKDAPANTYTLTVNSGTGGGNFAAGASVTITANAAPSGKVFDKWTATAGTLANANSATTTFTMPAGPATVTATYKDAPPTPANKTALNNRINEIGNTQKGNYSDDSWNAFQSALSTARSVAGDANATQAQVDSALAALNTAYANLKTIKRIFSTKYEATFLNWILFFLCFGFIWMWF
jgi:hypothetical protein